jgi:hypothetical protein
VKKNLFCLMLFFCGSSIISGAEIEGESKSLHTADYVNAGAELCVDAAEDLVGVPKEERKKRKRRFFKKVLVKIAALAMQAFTNSKINKGMPAQSIEESLGDSLYAKLENSPSRSFWTSALCIIKILSDLGDISEENSDPKRIENLLRDLRDVLTFDNLLEQCGRAGSFLTRLKNAENDEDWKALSESFLRATRQAAGCANDLLEVIQFYMKKKCTQMFAVLFPNAIGDTKAS